MAISHPPVYQFAKMVVAILGLLIKNGIQPRYEELKVEYEDCVGGQSFVYSEHQLVIIFHSDFFQMPKEAQLERWMFICDELDSQKPSQLAEIVEKMTHKKAL